MSTMAPLALVLAALATSPALAAKVDSSANHFLQRCRAVVDREIDQHFDIGICSGVMIAIHDEIHCSCCALVGSTSTSLG